MAQTIIDHETLIHALLDMGEAMMSCGAEVHRIEDTLTRIADAYGIREINVFVITSDITLTLGFDDGRSITRTRRIVKGESTDFTKLEKLNTLSRDLCVGRFDKAKLPEVICGITSAPERPVKSAAGFFLASAAFAVFFGGTVWDGLVAGTVGLLIFMLKRKLGPLCLNTVIYNLLASLISGLVIGLTARFIPALHMDKIMIGDIMLLVPGIGITNAVRDMLLGDTISGSMRLLESIIWTGALACGFMAAIWLTGGIA